MLTLLALATLTPQEQQQVVKAAVSETVCGIYINDDDKIYLRDLKFNVARRNSEAGAWLKGIEYGTREELAKGNYSPTLVECKPRLIEAFKQLELLRKL